MLCLAVPILRGVWLGLFELSHIQDWYDQFSYDWIELVFEVHE